MDFKRYGLLEIPQMAVYRMLGGECDLGDGRKFTFVKGKTLDVSCELPLDEMFKGQWEKISDTTQPTSRKAAFKREDEGVFEEPQEEMEAQEDETTPEGAESEEPDGQNVTDEFPQAADRDLLVFKNGQRYFIYDKQSPTAPLHKDVFKSKQQVTKFIKGFKE